MKSYREAVDAAANWLARLDDREVVAVIEMCARAVELLDQRTHGVNVLDGLERGARPHYRDLLRPSVYRDYDGDEEDLVVGRGERRG